MAKVLLINPPMLTKDGKYIDGYQGVRPKLPTLGLAYIAALLGKKGHNVKIIDGMAEVISSKEIALVSESFDVIGITSVTFLALLAHDVAKEIKKQSPDKPVIMGGAHASAVPEDVLLDNNIDYVVIGEGENTFLELVEKIQANKKVNDVNGIAYRENGEVILTDHRVVEENLDEIPMPARHLLPMHLYRSSEVRARRHPALHMMSTRGCPYNCSFCANKTIHRCRLRLHSAERVVEEMNMLVRDYGAREIHFWDDCFVYDEERVYKICNLLHKKNINVPWECEATITRVNPKLLKAIKKAGCFSISYGIEVGSEKRMNDINKGWLNRDKIYEAIKWTKEAGLRTRGYFMFGFVGETKEEMEITIKFAKELNLDFATFSLLVPLPGSLDYIRAQKEGIFDPLYWRNRILSEISFPMDPVYVPEGITKEELLKIHRRACNEFYFRPGLIMKKIIDLKSFSNLKGSVSAAVRMLSDKWS